MSSLCGYCASRSARLARSASLPKSIRPQAAASTSLPRLESAPRSTHSAAKSSSLWAARVSRRGFSHAATSPATPSPRCTTLVNATRVYRRFIACKAEPPTNPSEDFEPVEQELKEGEALEMHLTEAAIKQIERAQAKANDPTLSLRLIVESGGCHGYQYKMQVTNKRDSDDYRFAPPTETTASLLVDSASLPLVKGSTIDYATELIGSAFRIKDNPQSKDAGCGCGVSWELKDI